MKQKRCGQKIQNWHRPLGPAELRRRFRKHRHDDMEYDEQSRPRASWVEVDECWDCYDPPCGPDCPYCGRTDEDLRGYRLREFLRSLTDLPAPLVPFEWAVDAASTEAAEAAASSPPRR